MSYTPRSIRFDTPDEIELHCLHWPAKSAISGEGTVRGDTDSADFTPNTGSVDSEPSPIVLLHGGGANACWWMHLAERLATTHPVYALDFRGHGDSDHPSEREIGAFNLDLEAALAWLGREDVHLIGHSMGAAVAFDHASRFEATRSLVLIDLARGSTKGSGRRARLALALRRTYASHEEAVDRFCFLPESGHASEDLRRQIAERSVRAETDGRFGYKFDPRWFGLPSRPRPDPADVQCPTLLIRGEESPLLSAEAATELVAALPAGRLAEVTGAGHHVLVDQPAQLADLFDDFLAEIPE
jgi:pimeloyl-ACP methyl ester carboxylesterase